MLGLSESGIDKIRRSICKAAEETIDKKLRFFLPEWLRAWARYSAGGVLNEDGELDSPNSDSPWLEEKRKWDAKWSQARYETEIGQLIPRPQVCKVFSVLGGHFRRACDSMCPNCRASAESALDDAGDEMERTFPGNDNDSTNGSI